VAPAEVPGIPDIPAAPPVAAGVVSRCGLFGRLAETERVVQISAPAGSRKTVLVRSWIVDATLAARTAQVPVGRHAHHPLTAAAALVWSSDLSRPLQQMLFDTADSLTEPARPQATEVASLNTLTG
jgi:hypothetical protein